MTRSWLVSEENKLHVSLHVFSRPFPAQTFVPRCRRRYFNHTFDQSHSHENTFACGFCYIWRPRSFNNSFTCCSRHSIRTLFSIDSYIALTLILNPRDQIEVSSLKDFSKILSLSLHGEFNYSFINWFICFAFCYFFYNKGFLAFCWIFSASYIARRIIKLRESPGFWNHVAYIKCKHCDDVSTQAQKC